MSQHYFSTSLAGRPVTVLLGWDRPLGHVFMVVQLDPLDGDVLYEPDDAGRCLYSNLDERDAFSMDLDHYRRKLDELQIQVPASMWAQVDIDRELNVGNRSVRHVADGSFFEA
jgi:hypothetical protein